MIDVLTSIYLDASKKQLDVQREDVNDLTRNMSAQMIRDGFGTRPYSTVVSRICELTKDEVKYNGWETNDPDGVSWFLALYSESYCKFVNRTFSFDKVFSDCFRQYFSGHDLNAIFMKKLMD